MCYFHGGTGRASIIDAMVKNLRPLGDTMCKAAAPTPAPSTTLGKPKPKADGDGKIKIKTKPKSKSKPAPPARHLPLPLAKAKVKVKTTAPPRARARSDSCSSSGTNGTNDTTSSSSSSSPTPVPTPPTQRKTRARGKRDKPEPELELELDVLVGSGDTQWVEQKFVYLVGRRESVNIARGLDAVSRGGATVIGAIRVEALADEEAAVRVDIPAISAREYPLTLGSGDAIGWSFDAIASRVGGRSTMRAAPAVSTGPMMPADWNDVRLHEGVPPAPAPGEVQDVDLTEDHPVIRAIYTYYLNLARVRARRTPGTNVEVEAKRMFDDSCLMKCDGKRSVSRRNFDTMLARMRANVPLYANQLTDVIIEARPLVGDGARPVCVILSLDVLVL